MLGERERVIKLFEDQLHHALKFALLLRGQMIEVGLHCSIPSKHLRFLHPPSDKARGDGAP